MWAINREASQDNNTNRMDRKATTGTLRGFFATHASRRQGVIANDNLVPAVNDVHACGVVLNIGPGKALQPEIERIEASERRRTFETSPASNGGGTT